ncbi:odorant receptor 131-2-like [Pygocentrus nattereri]|uniref:G-protein coupled receptors family 1 profile domain-containing protein n=1 Tax=Pygocentrus nattereri TaxID=42514 RepID=A0A3B4BVC6_PYGNA|nr:odorant receptor 131-2-like [Pygocentrus nattereri]
MQITVNSSINMDLLMYTVSIHVPVVQVLVGIFLFVNGLMIFTFLKKEVFREDTRYILFAQTLFVDSAFMIVNNILFVCYSYQYRIHMIPCIILCLIMSFLYICTPLTLVAMCLERYVAICMPLRHADISTSRTRCFGFLIIWGISSIPALFTFIAYLSTARPGALFSYAFCSAEVMLGEEWLAQTRALIFQILFFFMIVVVLFTYIKIMIAARAASSDKKKSTNKSLRTVILHTFQLFLCIVQSIIPYIEMPFYKGDIMVFINLRYSNFVVFMIAPRCLSPLIYGLRDEKFFIVLRHYACCGFHGISQTLPIQSKIRPN